MFSQLLNRVVSGFKLWCRIILGQLAHYNCKTENFVNYRLGFTSGWSITIVKHYNLKPQLWINVNLNTTTCVQTHFRNTDGRSDLVVRHNCGVRPLCSQVREFRRRCRDHPSGARRTLMQRKRHSTDHRRWPNPCSQRRRGGNGIVTIPWTGGDAMLSIMALERDRGWARMQWGFWK